jgi:ABC-type polysaccharide/polyol phosphate export permease
MIGPFWTSITLAVYVLCVGAVGAGLSHQDLGVYLPFLVSGMIVWTLLSSLINEGCFVFIGGHSLFRNVRFEFSILLYALLWRSLLFFFHNLLVYLLVVLIWKRGVFGVTMLLTLPGLALMLANGAWIALVCGLFCLRFRDVQPLVATIVQIAMLVTPLLWPAESLSGGYRWIFVQFNPLYHLLDIVRAPFLGNLPSLTSYAIVLVITVGGWVFAFAVFRRFRSRIPYWS